jgi:hypothetical protein
MLTNLRLADLRLITAQQRTTGHNLPSDLYEWATWKFLSLVYFSALKVKAVFTALTDVGWLPSDTQRIYLKK